MNIILRVLLGQKCHVAVWFISPTASRVNHNVAIIDPNGLNGDSHCERGSLFADGDTSAAFTCQITQSGNWRVRVFGIDGESTGAYFIMAERSR